MGFGEGGKRQKLRCPSIALQVLLGLVWVWPESGPNALLESATKQPACCQLVKDVDPGARLLLLTTCTCPLCTADVHA